MLSQTFAVSPGLLVIVSGLAVPRSPAPGPARPATDATLPTERIQDLGTAVPPPAATIATHRHGIAVGWWGDRLAVGADGRRDGPPDPGSVGVYEETAKTPGGWRLARRLVSPRSAPGDEYGRSLSTDAEGLLVGAPGADDDRGAAWIVSDATPSRQRRVPVRARSGDRVGERVALAGSLALVGAPRADVDGRPDRGRAWAWTVPDSLEFADGSVRPVELEAPPSRTGLRFGWSLAIGPRLAVGVPGADVRALDASSSEAVDRAGLVTLFETTPPFISAGIRHRHPAGPLDRCGTAVAWSDERLVVGSPRGRCGSVRSGLVTVFDTVARESGHPCHPDGHAGERLTAAGGWVAFTVPGRRDRHGRRSPAVRLGTIDSRGIALVLEIVGFPSGAVLDVALSAEGDRLAIGAARHHEDSSGTGNAWVVELTPRPRSSKRSHREPPTTRPDSAGR